MTRLTVLSPIGTVRGGCFVAPPLPETWRGRTVGFLDNTKANFDRLADELGRLLRERYGVRAVLHRRKANAASAAAPGLIAELAKECDVVLAGSAD
jgi:hypothetical protein